VHFEVRDNGRGQPPSTFTDGTGLQHIRDRIEALGGHITITSTPGHGTLVRGCLPVPQR